jgi:hypothetical protein
VLVVENHHDRIQLGQDAAHEIRNGEPLTVRRLSLVAKMGEAVGRLEALCAEVAVVVLMAEIEGGDDD